MQRWTAYMVLGLAGSAFCVNEYQPIETGKTEVDAGYSLQAAYGYYDTAGSEVSSSSILNEIPMQVRYGILSGLDAEVEWNAKISDDKYGGGTAIAGMDRPEIALKYSPIKGVGAYADAVLPLVTGNLDMPKPDFGLKVGAVFSNRFGNFRAVATGSYLLNFKNSDEAVSGNLLDLYFKPEAMWTEYIGTYLGIKFDWRGDDKSNGVTAPNTGGYILTLAPGLNTLLLNWLAYEINVPITVIGKNNPASWGVAASVYATFPHS